MNTVISFRKFLFSSILLLAITHQVTSAYSKGFDCSKKGTAGLPELPEIFSTKVRANFIYGQKSGYTAEIKYVVNRKQGKELIEVTTQDRRVQYILRDDQKATLKITFKEDEYPVCDVTKTSDINDFIDSMDSKDIGPKGILKKAILAMQYSGKFYSAGPDLQDGIFASLYVGCLKDPKINVLFSFAVPEWGQPYDYPNVNYVARAEAQVDDDVYMTAYFSEFDPSTPDNTVFQPPENVYCKGLKSKLDMPTINDYFSYNAEIVNYVSAAALEPIITHRQVYYDYPSELARVDFYDALAADVDMFASIIAQKKSIIHDFQAGVQYNLDTMRGKCTQASFKTTFNVISAVETENNKMLNGKEFFWLDNAELSYNGQFPVRGVKADVYTAVKVDPETKKNAVVSWYFSTRETRVVEDVNVEKNVLLRMSIRPETGFGKQGVVEINFYDFMNEEPASSSYRITSCYNVTSTKFLVLTFPGNPLLRGSEKLIGMLAHMMLKQITGVRSTRISIEEVALNEKYLFVEFYLLEAPSDAIIDNKEISLDDAVKKLETAMKVKNVTLEVAVDKQVIKLAPEPDGLNVFAGDRVRTPSVVGYKEGGVISMAVGMLILGFLLGSVTLNLIMSRKFGVSLFQKGKYGDGPFTDSHESSM